MRTLLTLFFLAFWTAHLTAQVDAEIILEQDQFLRDEPVPVKVRITNRSGQTLRLGEGNDWIAFEVEANGKPAARIVEPTVAVPFELESAHVATREFNVQPWFEISSPGRYTVAATVRIKQWERQVSARPKPFEVTRGAKLWEQEVGLPTAVGVPETRRFILQQANYRKQLKLYVRVSNEPDNFAFQVLPLGSLVSFGRPEAQVDEQSHLHVLFQTGARSFQYSVITPTGVLTTRHTYDYTSNRPMLRLNENGKIVVAGGSRRMAANDLPPATAPSTQDVGPAAK
jgi:hypothetical protein